MDSNNNEKTELLVYDHLGNPFSSVKKMYEYWGLSGPLYYRRLKIGWTLKEVLTGIRDNATTYVDPWTGYVYYVLKDIADDYDLIYESVRRRNKKYAGDLKKILMGEIPEDVFKEKIPLARQRQQQRDLYE